MYAINQSGAHRWIKDENDLRPGEVASEIIPDPMTILSKVLEKRLSDVSGLFSQKMSVGFAFNDPQANPQIFAFDDSGLKWLDRAALRARKSKGNTENKTFKARVVGGKVVLTDLQLIELASDFYDWGTENDDVLQDHNDALHAIAEGVGTDAEKIIALNAYDETAGWP